MSRQKEAPVGAGAIKNEYRGTLSCSSTYGRNKITQRKTEILLDLRRSLFVYGHHWCALGKHGSPRSCPQIQTPGGMLGPRGPFAQTTGHTVPKPYVNNGLQISRSADALPVYHIHLTLNQSTYPLK